MSTDHYVPQFILKNWLKNNPKNGHTSLEVLSLADNSIIRRGTREVHAVDEYDGTARENLYARNEIRKIESRAGQVVAIVKKEGALPPRTVWEDPISRLAALQLLRSPRYRIAVAIANKIRIPLSRVPFGMMISNIDSIGATPEYAKSIVDNLEEVSNKLK